MMENLISVAVCDDEVSALKIISSAVVSIFSTKGYMVDVESFLEGRELVERMRFKNYALVFLDIEMPLNGIKLANTIRGRSENQTEIIFVSNNSARVFDTFCVHPFGFVRKNCFLKDIQDVVSSYITAYLDVPDSNRLIIRASDGLFSFAYNEIVYIECFGRNQNIHFSKRVEPFTVQSRMDQFEKKLCKNGFLRIHKGYIVNVSYIQVFRLDSVLLKVDSEGEMTQLPVSRRRMKDVKDEYLRIMCGREAFIV